MENIKIHEKIKEIKASVYRMAVLPEDDETLEEADMHTQKIINLLDEIENILMEIPQTAEEMKRCQYLKHLKDREINYSELRKNDFKFGSDLNMRDVCKMVRDTITSLVLNPQMPRLDKVTEMIHGLTKDPAFVSTIKEQTYSNTDWFRTVLTCGKSISSAFLEFSDVVTAIIPEIAPCIGFDQKSIYHKHDVYEHTLAVVDGCQTDDFCTKMAAFLHDIGKPSVCTEGAFGHRHFIGHAAASEKIAEKILYRLAFSGDEISVILELVDYHGMKILSSEEDVKAVMETHEMGFLQRWAKLRIADRNDHVYPKDTVFETDVEKILEIAENLAQNLEN